MATIGTYGFIVPDTGDESSIEWCIDQRANWVQVDTHNHDGVNSAALSPTVLPKTTFLLAAAGWALVANGIYSQAMNIAPALYANSQIVFQEVGGDFILLESNKTGVSLCNVLCNDSSLDILATLV